MFDRSIHVKLEAHILQGIDDSTAMSKIKVDTTMPAVVLRTPSARSLAGGSIMIDARGVPSLGTSHKARSSHQESSYHCDEYPNAGVGCASFRNDPTKKNSKRKPLQCIRRMGINRPFRLILISQFKLVPFRPSTLFMSLKDLFPHKLGPIEAET